MESISLHYDLTRENCSFVRAVAKAAIYRAPFSYHLSTPKREKGRRRQINVRKLTERAIRKKKKTPHEQSVRWAFALLCLFIPYGQTWTPYTRCWSRQARSVETRQTHHLRLPQQNTPLPVQHLRQRGLPPIPVPRPPLVRRTTKNSYRPWNVRRNPKNFATCSGGLRARHSSGSQDARKLESHVSEFRRWTLYRY